MYSLHSAQLVKVSQRNIVVGGANPNMSDETATGQSCNYCAEPNLETKSVKLLISHT